MKLNKCYYLKIEIEDISKEIEEMSFLSSQQLSGMPHGNTLSNPTEQYFLKKEMLENKLQRKKEKYIEALEEIENYIDTITDVEIRNIARARFIQNLKWKEISKKLNYERTVCYKKLKNYLEQQGIQMDSKKM